jgi:YbbR domain-containing protein
MRRIILHNFWLKFSSLTLATVIWMAIHYGIHNDFTITQLSINRILVQEYVRVPVSVIVAEGDTRVFKIMPNEVVVNVVGEESSLRKAAQRSIKAYVDLTNFHSRQSAEAEVHADVPADINLQEVTPAVVRVQQISP